MIQLDMPRIDPASLKLGVIDQHIKDFRGRVRRDSNDEEAHYGLGIAYYNLGLVDEAIEQILEAVRLIPESASIQLQLALLYSEQISPRRSRNAWSDAALKSLFRIDRALILQPTMLDALLFRAALFADKSFVDTDHFPIEDYVDDLAVAIDCWSDAHRIDHDSIREPISELLNSGPLPSRTALVSIPEFGEILFHAPQFAVSPGPFGRNRAKYEAAMNEFDEFMEGTIEDASRLLDALRYIHSEIKRRIKSAPQPRAVNR